MRIPLVSRIVILAPLATAFTAIAATPDYDAAHKEVVENLAAFVRVETMNPPGNETRGAQFLKGLLDREGIASEIVSADPARGNLIARLKGNGKKKPLLLMGHTDVVGVEREKWTVDPFAGVIKDGYLYGRGASDDKCMTTVCLEVFILLKRLKVPLDRDVIYVAEADEEAGSTGVKYLIANHWNKIACEFALNEGGGILEEDGKIKYVGVATSEKSPRTLFVSASGTSGHGSVPRPDNAVVHVANAISRIAAWQPPVRLNVTTRPFFERLAKISSPEDAWLYTHFNDPVVGPAVQEIMRKTDRLLLYNSMLRTSISPNVFKAGFKFNVIPGDALATLDVRALPDEDMPAFINQLNRIVDDPAVTITPAENVGNWPSTPPSPLESDMFASLERAQQAVFPNAPVLPTMLTGATDSSYLRAKGVHAYGLGSVSRPGSEGSRAHGNDERVQIAGIRPFIEFVYRAVTDVAAAK